MQFTLKANSADNKAYPAFSEDSSTLIVVNQEGNYYEIDILKGD